MRGAAASKSALPVCHLCGKQFGTNSIAIHQKTCKQKYERERGRRAPEAPVGHLSNADERPLSAGGPGTSAAEIEAYNDAAYDAWSKDLEPCPNCERRFLPDRLVVHMRSCAKQAAGDVLAAGSGQGGGGKVGMARDKGPNHVLPVCHLCGREFGTASLSIHLKTCKERFERERGRSAPEAPAFPASGDGDERAIVPRTQKEWGDYNEVCAWPRPLFSPSPDTAVAPCRHMRICQYPSDT